ncbi:hypothetical protein BJY24_005691 [Nocardia transvalensis]|uniref:Uncharacterized protein n=1 Tax=Nocardia transvalensis TaxID=37333 RepID=A0A7W9PIG5_9NOCA|nr:hypothetical protein [Nocardia transvalensis]MBB5916779.1 hypothetical protein [Nocardia transvalensis]
MPESGPLITAADITGGIGQVNEVTLLDQRHQVTLRYHLRIDDYLSQSTYVVEVFSPDRLAWQTVWAIAPGTYRYVEDGPDDPVRVVDPHSPFIASPFNSNLEMKRSSWQKIIGALADQAHAILPALRHTLPALWPAVSESTDSDGTAVIAIHTQALGAGRRCRVYVDTMPVFDAVPERGDHDVDLLDGYIDDLLRRRADDAAL